ncbi:MAG: hypothetical protein RLZZ453_171 [Chlamydiota bacterium]|jgi:hypothetical protein
MGIKLSANTETGYSGGVIGHLQGMLGYGSAEWKFQRNLQKIANICLDCYRAEIAAIKSLKKKLQELPKHHVGFVPGVSLSCAPGYFEKIKKCAQALQEMPQGRFSNDRLRQLVSHEMESVFSKELKGSNTQELKKRVSFFQEEITQDLIGTSCFRWGRFLQSIVLGRQGSYRFGGFAIRFLPGNYAHWVYKKTWRATIEKAGQAIPSYPLNILAFRSGRIFIHEMGHMVANWFYGYKPDHLHIAVGSGSAVLGGHVPFVPEYIKKLIQDFIEPTDPISFIKAACQVLYYLIKYRGAPKLEYILSDKQKHHLTVIAAAGPIISLAGSFISMSAKRWLILQAPLSPMQRFVCFTTILGLAEYENVLYEIFYAILSYTQADDGDYGLVRRLGTKYTKVTAVALFTTGVALNVLLYIKTITDIAKS